MIDLRKDIKITDQDAAILRKLEKKPSRRLSMDEYMEFLSQIFRMFPLAGKTKKKRLSYDRPFTLPCGTSEDQD